MALRIQDPILSVTHALEILESRTFRDSWEALQRTILAVPPPMRAAEPFTETGRPKTPKRQARSFGGRKAQCLFPVNQKQWNKDLDASLRSSGWDRQPFAIVGEGLGRLPTLLKGDFHKSGMFVEVEFGNAASFHRDLFKFHIAGRSGSGSVGVAVVMTDRLGRFADQGLTTYEQARSLLPYIQISLGLPIAVVGLTLDDFGPVRERYDLMRGVAESRGVECHPFERVFGETVVVELDESIGAP